MRRFAHVGKSLGQQVIQLFAFHSALGQFLGFLLDLIIRQLDEVRLKCVNFGNQRQCCFDFSIIRGAKNFFGQCSDT